MRKARTIALLLVAAVFFASCQTGSLSATDTAPSTHAGTPAGGTTESTSFARVEVTTPPPVTTVETDDRTSATETPTTEKPDITLPTVDFTTESTTSAPTAAPEPSTTVTEPPVVEPISYTVTYVTEGGTHSNPTVYEKDGLVLQDAVREGYIFDGWYRQDGTRVTEILPGTTGDLILTAQWLKIYTITYVTEGGTQSNPGAYVSRYAVPLRDAVREGYVFEGWYLDGVKVTMILPGTEGDLTLVAKWTKA